MFKIYKMRDDQVISFAADELKKYLWTMMPDSGLTPITLDAQSTDGFRLGLLSDFGLENEAKDAMMDDVVHIDTTTTGGILAGSNPRSVLFAVYRFLRLNGCRWFYPGPEGEYVPKKDIEPQKYHKLADHKVRGYTVEGKPSMEQVLDWVDYQAKMEMNLFVPSDIYVYMRVYYAHTRDSVRRKPEVLTPEQAEQWTRMLQAEAVKRGLLLKQGGHGTIPSAMGLDPRDREKYRNGEKDEKDLPEQFKKHIALRNGKRELFKKDIYFTNVCMSDPGVRTRLVQHIANKAQRQPFLCMTGVGFADGHHNHCECEKCQGLTPADFQIMIANELDEELSRRGMDTKVALSNYVDLLFPPKREKIKNPDRFFLQFTPITRSYTSSYHEGMELPEPLQYTARNEWTPPRGMDQCLALLNARRKDVKLPCYAYEYHFWRAQVRDPGLMAVSRRLYEDVRALRAMDIQGHQQDGSNKHFFPHGFHQYIHAETLVNRNCVYEDEMKDYFSHLYGEDYEKVIEYLEGVSDAFGEKYMNGEECADLSRDPLYNPERAVKLEQVYELGATARELVEKNRMTPVRIQATAWRLLERHTEYCEGLAEVFIAKAKGFNKLAVEKMDAFAADFSRYDFELERVLDFGLVVVNTRRVIVKFPQIQQ